MSNNEIIPAGTYRAKGIEAQLGFTSTNKEQVAISFQVLTPGFENQRLAYYGTFGEKALEITIKALRACGWTGLDLGDLTGVDANEVNLVVEHEEYNGVVSAKVKWVNDGAGGLLKNVMGDAEKLSFAQRMRGEVARLSQAQPKTPAPKAAAKPSGRPPEPPPHTDGDAPRGNPNDIPF